MNGARQSFELRRQSDHLVYVFERRLDSEGRVGFKRNDGDYWIIQHPRFGWIAGDYGSDAILGRPWNVLPSDQGNTPPEGIWVSRKGSKSYVYDLVYT